MPIFLLSYCEQVKINNYRMTNPKQYVNIQKLRLCKYTGTLNIISAKYVSAL